MCLAHDSTAGTTVSPLPDSGVFLRATGLRDPPAGIHIRLTGKRCHKTGLSTTIAYACKVNKFIPHLSIFSISFFIFNDLKATF